MGIFLGIDTSNYTTSMALLDWESGEDDAAGKTAAGRKRKTGSAAE